jgi:hypothetical protein
MVSLIALGGGDRGLTGEKGFTAGTGKVLLLVRCADILNVAESEVQDAHLDEAGEGCSHDLTHEHCPGWNLF